MKVASHAVVKWRETKPLPGELTNVRVNSATLPVKIEAARKAIAQCTNLPELLRYKDQAEGLAAAVRTMKHVGPEMIRDANKLMADAWRKGGELLARYKGAAIGLGGRKGTQISERRKVAASLGLSVNESANMVRVAESRPDSVYTCVQRSRSLQNVAQQLPPTKAARTVIRNSDAYRAVMGSGNACGLNNALYSVARIELSQFAKLEPDERKIVKAKIAGIQEILDEMDRLCR